MYLYAKLFANFKNPYKPISHNPVPSGLCPHPTVGVLQPPRCTPGSDGVRVPPQLLQDQAPSRQRRELEPPEPGEPPVTLATGRRPRSEAVLVSVGSGRASPRPSVAVPAVSWHWGRAPGPPEPRVPPQSCSAGTARCVWFECPLRHTELPSSFTLRARVWNSTFIEVSAVSPLSPVSLLHPCVPHCPRPCHHPCPHHHPCPPPPSSMRSHLCPPSIRVSLTIIPVPSLVAALSPVCPCPSPVSPPPAVPRSSGILTVSR